ncbi:MAG: VCBS repeat-containing protein [Bacteroidetes bacterium]|nr:VCBS repeat-containing protein [Bacteroidota bacterium]
MGSGTGTFGAAVNYAVGAYPTSLFSADFNGDGKMDLAASNFNDNNVSVLLNSGTGTFGAAVNYSVGATPISVFSADFNGDNNMDLVVTSGSNSSVSVLIGSGTGTFATAVNYAVGSGPYSVFSADFNGDGKMDLAAANEISNNISVLSGSGSGTFAAAVNYSVGTKPVSIFSADFNGDGKMDLATANNGGNNVSVLLSNYTPPVPGAALNFDGVNDFVNIPNNSSFNFGTNDFTIETYAKTSSVAGNKVMIGKISGGNNFWFGVSNGKANFSLIGGPDALGTSTIGDGNWHHLAAVRQSGVVSLYVDGVLEATQTNTGTATISADLTLGNFSGGFNFPGSLDEVRIWNRALCKGELLNNKNAELPSSQTGLVAYYNFNQGLENSNNSTIASLTDLSGNANHGTLNNFALSGTTSNWVAPGAVISGSAAPTYTPVLASISSQVNVLCNGGNNGSAIVTTTGGTSPYTYLASTGATVSTLSNLTAGAYTYTVTDANACKAIQTLTITQPSAIVTSTTVSNVLCNGGSTGSATVTTTGGTSPYTYLASTGATVSTLSNVTAGAYTYTVTDNNGCIKTQAFTITEPDILGTGLGIIPILCNGANNGQLTIDGIQGTSPYTYSWSTGATTQTITNLSPGVYTVTVTDANGCMKIRTQAITEPSPVTVTITASNSSICSGSSSTLTASASGGVGAYTYSWVAGPTANVSVVSPTTTTVYTVNVADDNSCLKSSTISIVANVCTPAEALSFDGVNDYVYVLNSNSFGFGTNDFTIETWEKTSSTTGNRVMLSKINGASNYWMGVSNGKAIFSMTGGPDAVGTTTIGDGNWHHIAAVRQNGVVSLYVDGVMEASQNNNGNVAIGGNFALGEFNGGYNFVGSLDEVRIWNTARTQCEINTYKNCEIPSNATALLANYHFNQGNAAVNNVGVVSLIDATSNNITGTLASFALNGTTSNWVAPGGVVSGYTTPAPAPTVSVNSGAICSGQSFTMMPTGASTYTYSNGTDVVTPTSNDSYTVTGTDGNGCSNTAVSSVTVNPLPVVFSNPGNVHACGDVSATFGVSSAGTNTYQWYFEYTQLPNDSDLIDGSYTEINFNTDTMTIQQVLTGNYNNYYVYCEVTNQYGCKAYSTNDTIWANSTPTITVNSGTICAGQSFTMVPNGASTYSYSNGSSVGNANS